MTRSPLTEGPLTTPPVLPPKLLSRSLLAGLVVAGIVAVAYGAVQFIQPPPPERAILPSIPFATEAELLAEPPKLVMTAHRFSPNPLIVVIDLPTFAEQGRMMNRIAAWIEKAGVPHDRVLDDAELAAAIRSSGTTSDTYYYGHDYRAADIARFFALSDENRVVLNADERRLRELLARIANEPLGLGAVITIVAVNSGSQTAIMNRTVILHHELSHGEFFTNRGYAGFVRSFWTDVLTASERDAFRAYLTNEGYDPAIDDLMINEMQAYLMHTASLTFFDPATLGISPQRLEALRKTFAAAMPSCWLKDVTDISPVRPVPRRRAPQRSRVSIRIAAAATLPPRRRRFSAAA